MESRAEEAVPGFRKQLAMGSHILQIRGEARAAQRTGLTYTRRDSSHQVDGGGQERVLRVSAEAIHIPSSAPERTRGSWSHLSLRVTRTLSQTKLHASEVPQRHP